MTVWTAAHQAPLSMGFYKQGILEWLVISPPGNLPDSGIKPRSPALQAGSSITSDRDAFPLLVQERHFPHGIFISYFQEDKGWSACVFCTHCFSSNFHPKLSFWMKVTWETVSENGIFWSGTVCFSLSSASDILSPCPAFSKTPIK